MNRGQGSFPLNTLLLGTIATILIGWVLHAGAHVLQPIAVAFLLAATLRPIVNALTRRRVPPALTVILLALALFLGSAQLGVLFEGNMRQFLSADTAGDTPSLAEGVASRLEHSHLPEALRGYLADEVRGIQLEKLIQGLALSGYSFVQALVLVLIYVVFLLAEQPILRAKVLGLAGERGAEAARILDTIGHDLQRYLVVKTAMSLLTGVLSYLALRALGIPYALLFALFTFLLNYIPTFGSIVAATFPVFTALGMEGGLGRATATLSAYVAINLLLGNYIEPKVLSRELNLSPFIVVLSVVVWAALWGVVGGILAVPLTAALQITLAAFPLTRPIAVLLGRAPGPEPHRACAPPLCANADAL